MTTDRLTRQTHAAWTPLTEQWAIAVLDLTVEQLQKHTGWAWDSVEEDGLGPMHYLPLAWDGSSRFLLSASGFYPGDGVSVDVDRHDDHAQARVDLLQGLGVTADQLLAITVGDTWFARWDPPHQAGVRPATASRRHFDG